jgi:thioredoxin 1
LDDLKSHELPILIDFGSDSCVPCKKMAPIIKELNHDLQNKAIILFVDVGKHPALAEGFPISIIPTQLLINSDGTPYIPSENLFPSVNYFRGIKKHNSETGEHVFTTHEGGLEKETILAMLKEMGMKDD